MSERLSTPGEKNELLAGRNAVYEALRAGLPTDKLFIVKGQPDGSLTRILALAGERGVPVIQVPRQRLDELCGHRKHQGVAAFAAAKDYCSLSDIIAYAESLDEKPFLLLADGLEDPHNLGAVIRTAEAAGVHGVVIPKRRSVGLTAAVAKSAAGALFHMRVARVPSLASTVTELKERGFWVFGADGGASVLYTDADYSGTALALVIGAEGTGISRLVLERCDMAVRIPMFGKVGSLNASAAAAVLLYEAVRQRKTAR